MRFLLLLTVCGSIAIAVGLLGLYAQVTVRLKKLEHDLKEHTDSEPDKIIITHEYSQKNAPKFGGF